MNLARTIFASKQQNIQILQQLFNTIDTKKNFIFPTQCIHVFRMGSTINADYFPIRHLLTGLFN